MAKQNEGIGVVFIVVRVFSNRLPKLPLALGCLRLFLGHLFVQYISES